MDYLKYLQNKHYCPICNHQLINDFRTDEIYCSYCGLVLFDYTPISSQQLNFIHIVNEILTEKNSEEKN